MSRSTKKTQTGELRDQRVLILTPTGRDAELSSRVLADANLVPFSCGTIEELCAQIENGAGVVFLTEEVLTAHAFDCLAKALQAQPAWSDVPIILLTSGGSESPDNVEALSRLSSIGNVNLIERPVRMMTLLSALKAALRARNRQYDVREHLEKELRIKQELEKAFTQVEEASRLKDEFLATVSHELRTPLNAVLGWTRLLRTHDLNPAEKQRALETIERSARSQHQLVEDLLEVSRAISGKLRLEPRPVSPRTFIEEAVEALRPTAQARRLRVRQKIESNLKDVNGDPARLRQVVWNLLSNAIKFSSAGGLIDLRARRVNSHLEISVKDYGQGINADFLPHVFERFRQADMTTTRAHGGLGLGLAIVRQIVELHGGTVSVESEGEGRGAKFTVKLPYLTASALASRSNDSAQELGQAGAAPLDLVGVKVLVVDDEDDTRELLHAALSKRGAHVTTAASAPAALRLLSRLKPDLLISDIGMPGTDGYELMRRVRSLPKERGGKIPAVALTAYARVRDRDRAIEAGYQVHLSKPIEIAELSATITQLLARPAASANGYH